MESAHTFAVGDACASVTRDWALVCQVDVAGPKARLTHLGLLGALACHSLCPLQGS